LGGLTECRNGYICRDYMGIADFVAFDREGRGVLIQVTSKSNLSSHRKKIRDNPYSKLLSERGIKILLLGFVKFENRWKCIEEEITLADLR